MSEELANPMLGQNVAIRKWFLFYIPLVLLGMAVTAYLFQHQSPEFYESLRQVPDIARKTKPWTKAIGETVKYIWNEPLAHANSELKFVFFLTYMCMATTFFPLPTAALVSFVATNRGQIVESDLLNGLIVAGFGSLASTIANLTDYHVFIALLRNKRIARIRDTRMYHTAARWFAKAPFSIMVIFNIILIPVDIPRMLAAMYGYPRKLFAASNFIGRLVRYSTVILITVLLGARYDWIGPVAFAALAVVIGLAKVIPAILRRHRQGQP